MIGLLKRVFESLKTFTLIVVLSFLILIGMFMTINVLECTANPDLEFWCD